MLIDDLTTLFCFHDLFRESQIMAKAGEYALECFPIILEISKGCWWA